MATIKDVAQASGVSVPTVYKVFNSSYSTSAEVRERVFTVAEELGYVPKAAKSKMMPSTGIKVIAIIVNKVTSSFQNLMLRDILKEIERCGYRLVVLYNNDDEIKEIENFNIIINHKFDGVIFTPVSLKQHDMVKQLIKNGFPMLQLFRKRYDNVDTMLFDDELGTYVAVKHFLQSGHRKILMICRRADLSHGSRVNGFEKAFEEYGLKADPNYIYGLGYEESIKEMLKKKIQETSPTAILSISEGITIGVFQSLKEMNLTIKEDISLIAYDDFPWLAACGITAIAHSFQSVGTLVAKLMDNHMKEQPGRPSQPETVLMLDPILISRDSVKILF